MQRLVKQRKESASLYKEQGREDLYEEEFYQQGIIEAYLPEQLSQEEIEDTFKANNSRSKCYFNERYGQSNGTSSKNICRKS